MHLYGGNQCRVSIRHDALLGVVVVCIGHFLVHMSKLNLKLVGIN